MPEMQQWSVKYRPRKLDDIVGNAATKKVARELLELKNSHALLISGPSGCGKTTLGKIIARSFAVEPSNIDERNVAADGGKDDARQMVEGARYMPMSKDGFKVFILEEAHGLTKQAASALLRPMEEPPHNRLLWMLLTDRPWMLDAAIVGRCRKLTIEAPTEQETAQYLYRIVREERSLRGLSQDERKKACVLIARYTGCVPREGVQLLQNAHDARIKDFSTLQKYVVTARAGGDAAMDRVAATILAELLTPGKAEKRVNTIVKAYATVDPIGLLNRMLFQLHALLLFALASKPNYAVRGLIDALGKNKPSIETMSRALLVLGRIRQQLREIVIDPSTMILPTLLELVFDTEK